MEFIPLAPPTSDSVDDGASETAPSTAGRSDPSLPFPLPPAHAEPEDLDDADTASMRSASASQEPLTPRSDRELEPLAAVRGTRRRESFLVDEEELLEAHAFSPTHQAFSLRMSPIPNSQLKMPLNYVSKTSKLNPENNFLQRQTSVFAMPLSEPSSSALFTGPEPVSPALPNPYFARVMESSTGPGKRKRAASQSTENGEPEPGGRRYEPYAKRHHRSLSGSWDRMGSPGGSPSQANAQPLREMPPPEPGPPSAGVSSPRLIPQVTTSGGFTGAMLNLTEAQELASRWSIGGKEKGMMEE
ncbi:hypothetical protein DFJ74DRAFT_671535 [Hyaloraphidium curvatum]|nr:hypothetical protein DFJ74DRAFT_671535 [Hyaloraphidium curvatum]